MKKIATILLLFISLSCYSQRLKLAERKLGNYLHLVVFIELMQPPQIRVKKDLRKPVIHPVVKGKLAQYNPVLLQPPATVLGGSRRPAGYAVSRSRR